MALEFSLQPHFPPNAEILKFIMLFGHAWHNNINITANINNVNITTNFFPPSKKKLYETLAVS